MNNSIELTPDEKSRKDRINGYKQKYRDTHKEKTKEYYLENREKKQAYSRRYSREYYRKNKDKTIEHQRQYYKEVKNKFVQMYGGQCSCCGETIIDFLTIEHKLGQTKEARETGARAYRTALKEYRPDLYEILCWNCNCAKGQLGYCPHHPPEVVESHKIHNINRPYNYSKEVDSLGRRYK